MNKIAVVGAGAWGSALAMQALRAGCQVSLWARNPGPLRATRRSPHLPDWPLPDGVAVLDTLPGPGLDAVLLAVPVQHLREVAAKLRAPAPLVVCCKGIEAGTGRLPLEIVAELHPGCPGAVLTGPNFAHEVAAGLPAAAVLACADPGLRGRLAGMLASPGFRVYGGDDPLGAGLGGAAKNVVAIAAGAVMGAGLGENARAALITRGLAELSRLVAACGGRTETVAGLSGLGDLLLTCTGGASRNYTLGLALGRGESVGNVLTGRSGVTEGVATAPALLARAADVGLPICTAVDALLAGRTTLDGAIAALLARPRRDE